MTTMTGKEVLRAIADGADPSEFEWISPYNKWQKFNPKSWFLVEVVDQKYKFRRKPRTRVVNGFTVPAPIQEMPQHGDVLWWIDVGGDDWCFDSSYARGEYPDENFYSRGLLFSTKEAAIANAKAMCGIDPESE